MWRVRIMIRNKFSSPNERNDVQRRWVVGISQEVHESVHDGSCDFREANSADMDGLDKQLPIFRRLHGTFHISRIKQEVRTIELTFSNSCSCVRCSCFFMNKTTSSTVRLETKLRTMPIALRRTSRSVLVRLLEHEVDRYTVPKQTYLDRTCRMSIMRLSKTCPCRERRASRRSRTMSFALLSDSRMTRLM